MINAHNSLTTSQKRPNALVSEPTSRRHAFLALPYSLGAQFSYRRQYLISGQNYDGGNYLLKIRIVLITTSQLRTKASVPLYEGVQFTCANKKCLKLGYPSPKWAESLGETIAWPC